MTVELVAPSISVTLLEPSLAMKILSVTGVGAVISPALECIYHREGLRLRRLSHEQPNQQGKTNFRKFCE